MKNLKLLALIEQAWEQNPDLRLCQLIGNCFDENDLYYKTDEELIERLSTEYVEEVSP